jgi:hypothetical protein
MLKKIVSGGQTGADRAALDFAIKSNIPHSGWVPKGRIAEDGPIAEKYNLTEMPTDSYHARTEQNVIDSDGTLIISHGPLTGGSEYTHEMAKKHRKPCLVIDLARTKVYEAGTTIMIWITGNKISTLNMAGPRASKNPYIYDQVTEILELVLYLFNLQKENPLMAGQESPLGNVTPGPQVFLKTVDEVVESVLAELSLEEKSIFSKTSEENLPILTHLLASFIDTKIGDSTVNQELIEDCRRRAGNIDLDAAEASKVIIEAIWEKVRETHRLRVVK